MTKIENIAYRANEPRATGTLYLPDRPQSAPVALLVSGEVWQGHDRVGMDGVARMLLKMGYAVFDIDYRPTAKAPWPACAEDVLAAANFLADARRSAMRGLDRRRLLLLGIAAGGHLALTTGFNLPRDQVAGIVSLAGPVDLRGQIARQDGLDLPDIFWQRFFGTREVSPTMRREASPLYQVPAHPPPLLCIHSVNDEQVRLEQSEQMVAACCEQNGQAELFVVEGQAQRHGLWVDPKAETPRLLPAIEDAIDKFTREL